MREIFIKNRIIIFRTLGLVMLLVGFSVHIWTSPKEVLIENEIAAANVARMEASVAVARVSRKEAPKSEASKFIEELENAQNKQIQYLTMLSMALGVGLLAYSFIGKPKNV
ncbi:MAG: hypothetical protein PHQ93_05935 [Sulfurimonas sp.]|uniref:hypothetical protein n=1 Tax=Sulfurimonas sp. TaxID=2022749 RepID=UPI0026206FAC|nr:hypothetical protein [Sulfurimonas sp.]MDD5400704.1 hypothetical protein [Sulfurimonas sp.]